MFYGKALLNEGKLTNWLWKKIADAQIKSEQDQYKKDRDEKKKAFNSLSSADKKKVEEYLKKKEKEFEASAKEELKKLLTPAYKKKIRKAIDKGFKDGDLDKEDYEEYYNNDKIPKLGVVADGPGWDIILGEGQDMNNLIGFICVDMAEIMSKKTGYTVGFGDGDEGGIDVKEFQFIEDFYLKVYKKEVEGK